MTGAPPLPPPPAPGAALPARRGSGKATAALACGVAGLVTGFAIVTLLVAVVANVLGSYALQEIAADPGLEGRGRAVGGIWCGVAAIVLWGAVGAAVLAAGAG